MPRNPGKASRESLDVGGVRAALRRGDAITEDDLHVHRPFPAAQGTGPTVTGKIAVVFVIKGDLLKVADQHFAGKGRVFTATVLAQQILVQLRLLNLMQIAAQHGAFLRSGFGHHSRRGGLCRRAGLRLGDLLQDGRGFGAGQQ